MRNVKSSIFSALVGAAVASPLIMAIAATPDGAMAADAAAADIATATPIKHLVVIFQENVSFDHYFATYPYAANPAASRVLAAPGTPSRQRPHRHAADQQSERLQHAGEWCGRDQSLPPGSQQAATADQDHDYTPEQLAFMTGLMDAFPASVGTAGPPPTGTPIALTTA